ncbi:hypothetical protein DEO72_LG3g1593 [Vigna unguiculata]|uniref:Uncharacterized protein n=1 Tax=Vigna unguiculata TaxID=3917 RepID=A0A4D6LEN8_VIGUN|nr:hypothetical protein DEO72_LG3g1593 [Vigna unguiculata]
MVAGAVARCCSGGSCVEMVNSKLVQVLAVVAAGADAFPAWWFCCVMVREEKMVVVATVPFVCFVVAAGSHRSVCVAEKMLRREGCGNGAGAGTRGMDKNEGGSRWWCSLLVFATALLQTPARLA